MKKVLIIAYYWPPSGGAGVQRWLKMVKYLPEFGWQPIVYTAKDAAYPVLDDSLEKDVPKDLDVMRGPIWEPYEVYKRFTGQGKKKRVYSGFLSEDKKPSLTQRLSVWIRGNFFIPDARRFWIKPSIKLLTEYLQKHPVDAIITTGPPHSLHLIGRGLKRNLGVPWIADFRDPWTNIDFYDQLMLTGWADRTHRRQEASVLAESDAITTIGWTMQKEFEEMGAQKVFVATNGFDEADFPEMDVRLKEKFTFSHIGYLNKDRSPANLWQAFGELVEEIPGFKDDLALRFIGKTDHVLHQALEQHGLSELAEHIDYVPHDEVLVAQRESHVLLLLINNTPNVLGILPGKLFEYLAARRPILAIGIKGGDSDRVLTETGAGNMLEYEDLEGMKRTIFKLYRRFKKNDLQIDAADIQRFSRRHNAGLIAEALEEIKAS